MYFAYKTSKNNSLKMNTKINKLLILNGIKSHTILFLIVNLLNF